jgi:tryptophanyl-tRNA synthetase
MYTDPEHLRASDPGRVEGNVVFAYLRAFDPDSEAVAELERHYAHGGLGDVALKRRLEDVLQQLVAPMRERRTLFARELSFVRAVVREGTERAEAVTRDTLQRVRAAFSLS